MAKLPQLNFALSLVVHVFPPVYYARYARHWHRSAAGSNFALPKGLPK